MKLHFVDKLKRVLSVLEREEITEEEKSLCLTLLREVVNGGAERELLKKRLAEECRRNRRGFARRD